LFGLLALHLFLMILVDLLGFFCLFCFRSFSCLLSLFDLLAGDLIYDALSRLHSTTRRTELADQIRELMTDEHAPEKIAVMSQYLDMLEMDVKSEHRYEDEEWFEGE
jgi:hypothetical protein